MEATCLHELVEAQAAKRPAAPAVIMENRHVTFGELNCRANRLARHLRECGAGREMLVGLHLDRSPHLFTALLAIMKTGAAYVPLDPEHPAQRRGLIIKDAGLSVILTRSHLPVPFEGGEVRAIDLDADKAIIARQTRGNLATEVHGQNLCYCAYTSGTTGRPKGVAVSVASVMNHVRHMAQALRMRNGDRVLQFTSIAIDAALEEIFPAWACGAAVVVRPPDVPAPDHFLAFLRGSRTSVVSLPSSYWHSWVDALARAPGERPPSLRFVFVGGERLFSGKLRQWRSLPWTHEVQWMSDYGPTEATISCTTFRGEPAPQHHTVPIGRPISNAVVYVLDAAMEPVAGGAHGELYVGGACVARGYHGRPDLTAERFLPDPFAGAGARMYRTGDKGFMLPDGQLQFTGRTDDQVKILGHRVELSEVEAAIRGCEGVRDALVVAREDGPASEMRLIAYVVAEDTSASGLRQRLSETLLPAMMPSHIVWLDRIPVSSVTGKVDRSRLPPPVEPAHRYVGGAGQLEQAIANLFRQVLGCGSVSPHDGFFMLGGDSLRALQLLSVIRETIGIDVGYARFREAHSGTGLAALLRTMSDASEADLVARIEGAGPAGRCSPPPRGARCVPASNAQERFWLLDRQHDNAPTYSIPFAYWVRRNFSVRELDAALTRIVARHEALRTALLEQGGRLWQQISDPMPVASRVVHAASADAALGLAGRSAREPFDLRAAPLFRSLCIRVRADEHLVVMNFHHAIFDAWAHGLFVGELNALYGHAESAQLPTPAMQYDDFVESQREWLRGTQAQRQRAYWQDRLGGELPILRLPSDCAAQDAPATRGGIERVRIDGEVFRSLRRTAERLGATEFTVMLAAFVATLHRYTRQEEIVVGVPVACRSMPGAAGIIGCLCNTVALRLRVDPGLRFAKLVEATDRALAQAMAHQDLPFDQVVDVLGCPRDAHKNPLYQAMFVMQSTPAGGALELRGLAVEEVIIHSGTAKLDLTCSLRASTAGGFEGELEYAESVLGGGATRWVETFTTLLGDAVARPCTRVDELALIGVAGQRAIVNRANSVFECYSDLSPLHVAFERQVQRDPDAIAIEGCRSAIRYGELNARANRLARRLVRLAAAPENYVGICLERSVELVIAVLAVLKSGAAFVPLDPAQPLDRRRLIAKNAGVMAIVTDSASLALWQLPVITVTESHDDAHTDAVCASRGAHDSRDLDVAVSLDNAAYAYYTSGSTGSPKGVVLDHRAAMNRLEWLKRRYALEPGQRVVHKSPLIFDVSIWEIFGALSAGATILLADARQEADLTHVAGLLAGPSTVFAHFVPSMLDAYLGATSHRQYPGLRWVQVSGEALPSHVVERFFRHFASAELHSLYGQTETSEVAAWEGRQWRGKYGAPLGTQIGIYRLYVLDDSFVPVPPGAPGELYVAGVGGLARGYHGQPAMTAERFLPNPFAVCGGERLYRTGDLVVVDEEGILRFLGRLDEQRKIRGCRVEVAEVEAAVARHESVRSCAVVAREDESKAIELVAYVVGETDRADELAAHVKRHLPAYMHPAAYIYIAALPTTSSGKLDRRALPSPRLVDRGARTPDDPPCGPLEERIAEKWKHVLQLENVGRTADFFALGGNSLKCSQLLGWIKASFDIHVRIRDFVQAPTIKALACLVERLTVEMVDSLHDDEVQHYLQRLGV